MQIPMNGSVPACHRIREIPDLSPLYREGLSKATQTLLLAAKALGNLRSWVATKLEQGLNAQEFVMQNTLFARTKYFVV